MLEAVWKKQDQEYFSIQTMKKTETNSKSPLIKLDKTLIAKEIIPYLDIKDIINFRSTCKDINTSISSIVALVSYYKAINSKKHSTLEPNLNISMLKPFSELNDTNDIEIELESLKQVSINLILR